MVRENFGPNEWYHKLLESELPFIAMRFYVSSKLLKSSEMRNFMHQGNKKAVLIKAGINGNTVVATGIAVVIAVAGNPFANYLKMYPI